MLSLTKKSRLSIAIAISCCFFLAEIAVGFYTRSLALIADAFHVSFDLISFSIALAAVHVSEKNRTAHGMSFGWQRAQLLGSFFNGVFQLALGFSIILLSIERFIFLEQVDDPMLVLIIACAGLASNVLAGAFLGVHNHSHGDEPGDLNVELLTGHEDMGHRHHISPAKPKWWKNIRSADVSDLHVEDGGAIAAHPHSQVHAPGGHHHDLGMKAVLIHVLGDALNNLGVILMAVIIWKGSSHDRFYADPAMSLMIGLMLILTAWKLTIRGGKILMLSEPLGVDAADVKHDLEKVPGVLSVHELHVWRLNEEKSCATVHVVMDDASVHQFRRIAKTINECLHAYGIHSATIQPEAIESHTSSMNPDTALNSPFGCGFQCGDICGEKRCCA